VNDDLQRAAAANADAVLRRFFDADGRLKTLPAKQSRQLAVYDLIAQRFIPGVRYTELEVNRQLMSLYDDYVTLRRGLIDFGLMDRANGQYWRSGGTVAIGTPPLPAPVAAPRMGSAPSPRGAARREAILTAAAQLFAERGYAAVGMDDIGAAAGVTGPAIYRHFGAKATVLTSRRGLMAVFIREVHSLPPEDRALLDERQRALIGLWRALLARAHPEWDGERVRTAVHGAFGMLNAVATFESPLTDRELARQLGELAVNALQLGADG
jgi:AcrR family transcriptional regulator